MRLIFWISGWRKRGREEKKRKGEKRRKRREKKKRIINLLEITFNKPIFGYFKLWYQSRLNQILDIGYILLYDYLFQALVQTHIGQPDRIVRKCT